MNHFFCLCSFTFNTTLILCTQLPITKYIYLRFDCIFKLVFKYLFLKTEST